MRARRSQTSPPRVGLTKNPRIGRFGRMFAASRQAGLVAALVSGFLLMALIGQFDLLDPDWNPVFVDLSGESGGSAFPELTRLPFEVSLNQPLFRFDPKWFVSGRVRPERSRISSDAPASGIFRPPRFSAVAC